MRGTKENCKYVWKNICNEMYKEWYIRSLHTRGKVMLLTEWFKLLGIERGAGNYTLDQLVDIRSSARSLIDSLN